VLAERRSMNINLKALGLEKKWPRLATLQAEIADLEKHTRQAEMEVDARRAAIQPAREQDLDAAAKAVRSGAKSPKTSNEDEARGRLQVAERNHAVMTRALENARTDYGAYLQKHRAPLFADVAQQRQEIAREAATAARVALAAYSRFEDLHYVLKGLEPPVVAADHNAPAQRLTTSVLGIKTTGPTGPDRGQVEQMLAYVASLGQDATEGDDDAAA
jgi:hypothetical protein